MMYTSEFPKDDQMNSKYASKFFSLRILATFVILCLSSSMSFAVEIMIPGTSVTLDAPDGFIVAGGFSGLENPGTGSSITIAEIPAEAYEEFAKVFTDFDAAIPVLAQQGVSVERATSFEVAGQQVPVLIGHQMAFDIRVEKYVALFRGDVTVIMTFNIVEPQIETSESIEIAIRSVRLSAPATLEEKLAQLPFSFTSVSPFRVNDILAGSGAVLSTIDGQDPAGLIPAVIIVRALSPVTTSTDAEAVAKQILASVQGFEGAEVTSSEEVNFGGGSGVYLEAITEERKIVQYLRVPPDGMYIRLVAYGAIADLDKLLPTVMDIAQTVSVRQ